MTKTEILKKIANARLTSRLFLYKGKLEETSVYDRVTDKLIVTAEEMGVDWNEIESALLDANETAEMCRDELM